MSLQLTDVVLKEIVGHRMEPVVEAAEKLQSSITALQRLATLDFSPTRDQVEQMNLLTAAEQRFDCEVRQYVTQCRGEVLPLSDIDPELLFIKYFAGEPPFGLRADKKSEFPDAAALLLLEQRAEALNTKAIVASRDTGWKGFAEQSEHLYCVSSLEDLAALFAATGAHAQAVKERITAAVNDENSVLRGQLTEKLEEHISDAYWDTEELYSGGHRFEAEKDSSTLRSYSVKDNSLNIWKVDGEPGAWVVELAAIVEANVVVDVKLPLGFNRP